jgi:hypothetical protein
MSEDKFEGKDEVVEAHKRKANDELLDVELHSHKRKAIDEPGSDDDSDDVEAHVKRR